MVADELASGKVAEEGDADPSQALEHYRAVVDQYQNVRKSAAHAWFRIGEILRFQAKQDEALSAYLRVIQEFPDQSELARLAADASARLGAPSTGAGSSGMPGETRREGGTPAPAQPDASTSQRYVMSPELMRRYGLMPSATPTPTPSQAGSQPGFGMSPELRKRYGLDIASSNAEAADPNSSTPAGTTMTMSPELMRRYGLMPPAVSPPVTPTPTDPAALRREGELGALGMALAELRSEATRVNRELREVSRELRATENVSFTLIPTRMVKDPALLRLVDEVEMAKQTATRTVSEADQKEREQAYRRLLNVAEQYFQETYRKRLEVSQTLLREELDRLRAEIDATNTQWEKLQSTR
ncbi:MAG: tetratricopeptide repeat protein [Verrucomicrobiales bacterium]|nr:tetratricopeptide repeat protein [Verrucomicrobiales bacterium]